ncbi:MAG: riboflavin synthase [Candidatus Cloacimonadaceae bacterium]|nr:riboflavin synthase [Candidatus Cloacimonadaceae bacterium]
MFTGIIESVQKIQSIRLSKDKKIIGFCLPESFTDIQIGASIACNGICLTVLRFDKATFEVEIMNETLSKTTAASWTVGAKVNLERAMQTGARLDGHWVQGHIDTALPLSAKKTISSTLYLQFEYPSRDADLLVAQGSIAINGVSLTIAELTERKFGVALIGHTLQNSNLGSLSVGEHVNIEYDILGKYIARMYNKTGTSDQKITREWLYEQGF